LGKHFDEKSIIRAAYAFEQTREYVRPAYAVERGL
jgi:aspartyl-tRNA(Asn)/glutamyl-tRNA(Gln) amidotransferase subunit A